MIVELLTPAWFPHVSENTVLVGFAIVLGIAAFLPDRRRRK